MITNTNTSMKKIMIIDGGPRKGMNTAQMVEAFIEGAKFASDDIEVKHVRLYDLDAYRGCMSCMAFNTYQMKDYSRYEFAENTPAEKQAYKDEHWS